MNTTVVSPTPTLAAGAVLCANQSTAQSSDRTLIHVALSEGEWEALEVKQASFKKKKLSGYINKILIEFFPKTKKAAQAHVTPGERVFRHFLLPPQTTDFYEKMAMLYGLPVATFVTRYVLVPAICGFHANVSMEDSQETDELVYALGSELIATYYARGVTQYRQIVGDLKLTYGEEAISSAFLSRFRWIYTEYCTVLFAAPTVTPAPVFELLPITQLEAPVWKHNA